MGKKGVRGGIKIYLLKEELLVSEVNIYVILWYQQSAIDCRQIAANYGHVLPQH
jgi:hypothetical protein